MFKDKRISFDKENMQNMYSVTVCPQMAAVKRGHASVHVCISMFASRLVHLSCWQQDALRPVHQGIPDTTTGKPAAAVI